MPTIIKKYGTVEMHGAHMLSERAAYISEMPVGAIQDGGYVCITRNMTILTNVSNDNYRIPFQRVFYGPGTIIHNNKIINANQLIGPPYTVFIRKKRVHIYGFKAKNEITVSVKVLKKKKINKNKDIVYSYWRILAILSYSTKLRNILEKKNWGAFIELVRQRWVDDLHLDILRAALMEE